MRLMIVVGARPNFMKAAPILDAISQHNTVRSNESEKIHPILVHTGQHYDAAMSDAFFADLKLPHPDVFLGVGSGSHAAQTAEVMRRFEEVLLREKPDVLVVLGDVNSTVACALVAAKISFDPNGRKPVLVHVEAGLRSFDRSMPEERNRVVTDHLSDLLFVTEQSGLTNLHNEGIPNERVYFVGNTMIDSLRTFEPQADKSTVLERLGIASSKSYVLLTLHRPSNVDTREAFLEILEGIQEVGRTHEIVFPAHPRTQKQITQHGLDSYFRFSRAESKPGKAQAQIEGISLVEPQGYLDFVCLMKNARLVVTDSGGIQEETTCLGVPCVTVRENTERPVTLISGTNVLGGTGRDGIRKAIRAQVGRQHETRIPELWDGKASSRIVEILTQSAASSAEPMHVEQGKDRPKESVCSS